MKGKIHAMIPARYGSTRLKLKNLALLDGKPLISYALNAAKDSGSFDRICINSDHRIFRDIADRYGVEFYQRPNQLGGSEVKSDDVIADYFDKHPAADILFWVNPIAPFQTAKEVKSIVNKFLDKKLDSLITVEEKQVHCDFNASPVNYSKNQKFAQTQELMPVNPFVYSVMGWRREAFISHDQSVGSALFCGSFGTYTVGKLSSIIIKTSEDLQIADHLMKATHGWAEYIPTYDDILNENEPLG